MTLKRYVQLSKAIVEEWKQEEKEKWIHSAFIGWQMIGAFGAEIPFGKYLQKLGLEDAPEQPKMSAAEIIAGAEETLRKMREKV